MGEGKLALWVNGSEGQRQRMQTLSLALLHCDLFVCTIVLFFFFFCRKFKLEDFWLEVWHLNQVTALIQKAACLGPLGIQFLAHGMRWR